MNGLQNCPYCKDFYTADFYNEYINFQDKTEPSSFHLISEICQKDYFLQQQFLVNLTPGTPDLNANLSLTRDLLWKYMQPKYKKLIGYPLFLQILYKIISNAHVSSDPLGVGIYPLVSQCNHSCDSNCCYWVEDGKIVLAAEQNIKSGAEITYSYIKEVY